MREHADQSATAERSTWDALYGIASNGQEPPTDEQVARWLDEHQMEQYGGLGRAGKPAHTTQIIAKIHF